ncbi:VIN3-like protein 2 isoform X1 [Chenopodium quinoa]|uniref:VIN3-like protein 2 isoform X1 n=2 Tax=Chenopodium quinoa TaxID=63459 RepID=UPI000B791C50|nr:VIN3-like protein 2 isoform X1 [Chenopodium quinoa]
MNSSAFDGDVLDPVKCSKLSMEERREIVYELAKWPNGAAEVLQSWSRQDILQILCSEMGKERKYTGLTKLKIVEHLLKVVSEKSLVNHDSGVHGQLSSPPIVNKGLKKPRKSDNPSHLLVSATNISTCNSDSDLGTAKYCKNSACKARLSKEDKFCKRCTCCICHKYDDNKDPSLWLTCSSEPPFPGDSCNMSCHLECAIKHDRSGIARNGLVSQLDGSFYCISCGKMNDLMSCWRKQLTIAKDTRRVDILCYRISLSQKLLAGTKKYFKPSDIIDDAIKLLEAEVGALTGVPVKMGRGIVNRLSSGQEVQRLCASAVELFDSMYHQTPLHLGSRKIASSMIRVEAVNATSVIVVLGPDSLSEKNVGYTLWHRKANDRKGPEQPTCTLFPPQTRFIVSGLSPVTEYVFRAICFDNTKELSSSEVRLTTSISTDEVAKCSTMERIQSPATNCSTLSNPSSVEDETNNTAPCSNLNENKNENYFNCSNDQNPSSASVEDNATGKFDSSDQYDAVKVDIKHSPDGQVGEAMSIDIGFSGPEKTNTPCVRPETSLPITPCRQESSKEGSGKKCPLKSHNKDQDGRLNKEEANERRSSKKRKVEREKEECVGDDSSESNLEYYIKMIRWLECEGHIDKSFRQKFLTWYSIRATPQEIRIVKAFVDTLNDDPASLAEQLQDTFEEIISSKKLPVVPPGFCLKLWH